MHAMRATCFCQILRCAQYTSRLQRSGRVCIETMCCDQFKQIFARCLCRSTVQNIQCLHLKSCCVMSADDWTVRLSLPLHNRCSMKHALKLSINADSGRSSTVFTAMTLSLLQLWSHQQVAKLKCTCLLQSSASWNLSYTSKPVARLEMSTASAWW